MSMIDNIITAILIAGVFGAAGIIYFHNQTSTNIARLEQKQLFFTQDNLDNDFETFLELTEKDSGKDFSTLISYAMYRRRDLIPYFDPSDPNAVVNVPEQVEFTLDRMFGAGNYFLNITQDVYDIGINFILDGSPSLTAERRFLRDHLLTDIMPSAVVPGRTIDVNIYLLSKDTTMCASEGWDTVMTDLMTTFTDMTASCMSIHGEQDSADATQAARCIYPTIFDAAGSFKNRYEIFPPYNFRDKPETERQPYYYYEADWAAGTAYSIGKADLAGNAAVSLHFPMAGELSTGSAPDSCYTSTFTPPVTRVFCEFCQPACTDNGVTDTDTELRSWETVEKATRMAVDMNQVINPIYAWKANYYSPATDPAFDSIWNTWLTIYNANEGTSFASSFCQDPSCQGCNGNRLNVEFHPECQNEIQTQMHYMEAQTGGDFSTINDPSDIAAAVGATVTAYKTPYAITVGTDQPGRERLTFEKKILMPVGNDFVTVRMNLFR